MEIVQKIKTIIYDALSSCQSCGLPEPCYHELVIDEITALPFDEFTRKEVFHWPRDNFLISPTVMRTESQELKLAVNIRELHHSDIHTALIASEDGHYQKELIINQDNHVDLPLHTEPFEFTPEYMWDMILSRFTPIDVFKSTTFYIKMVRCDNFVLTKMILVRPAVKIGFSVNFTYDLETGTREDSDRKKEQRDKKIETAKANNQTLPKNMNHLHQGWTLHTVPFFKTATTSMEMKFLCEVAGREYSFSPYKSESSEITLLDNVKKLAKMDKVISVFKEKVINVSPTAKKSEKKEFPIFSLAMKPIDIGISVYYEDKENPPKTKMAMGIKGDPFFGIEMKIDVLQIIASLGGPGVKKFVEKIRATLDDRDDFYQKHKDDALALSAGIKADIVLFTDVTFFIGVSREENGPAQFECDDTAIGVGFRGEVSAHLNTKVLCIIASLDAGFKIETKGKIEIDNHDDGVDAVLCHDGITLKAWFNADISLADKAEDESINEDVAFGGEPYSCALANKLDKDHSNARINIIGNERRVPDRESFTPVLVKGAVNNIDEAKAMEAVETATAAVAGTAAAKTAGVVKAGEMEKNADTKKA
ncbi:hypothetical protein H8R13_15935 [Morganella morganii]|uniref:hypothetical protein n=1 Tax=Morganella morganii TaxID=582 RepID=UPI00164C6CDE|nr:hypothetical protein [Morganella morganii]MBC4013217.1 hypothetical protein [Morganella morganii]